MCLCWKGLRQNQRSCGPRGLFQVRRSLMVASTRTLWVSNKVFTGFVIIAALLMAAPAAVFAASCTTQAELTPEDRGTLASIGEQLSDAVIRQDTSALQTVLLPALSGQWDGIRGAVEQAAPMVKGGKAQLRNIYLLDASTLTTPGDTQFFCSSQNGSMTVTISMHSLPPGKYALVLSDATGAPLAGQLAFVLAWDQTGAAPGWKLGGFSARQGNFNGHDGVWYWTRARELAQSNMPWAAWYCYDTARYLELPVDFISSPNLDKLVQEQSQIKGGPTEDTFPYSVKSGDRTWKIDSIRLDASLHEPDLGVTYESAGASDPAVARTEAIAVLGALLKTQPGLRENFHGMWAYASTNGKVTPVMELPMAQIP